jgi:DNA-binding GntR family transcriptional regulator
MQQTHNLQDYYGRMLNDMQFHMAVAALSGRHIQLKMLQELFDLLLLKYSRNLVLTSIMDSSLQDHRLLFEHLQAKNVAAAREALTIHLHTVCDHILVNLQRLTVHKKEIPMDLFAFQ